MIKGLFGRVRQEVEGKSVQRRTTIESASGFFFAGRQKHILCILVSCKTVTSLVMGTCLFPTPDTKEELHLVL